MEEDFKEYLKEARQRFCKETQKYNVRDYLKLRTEVDSFLLAYDQAVSKAFSLQGVVASVLCISDELDCLNLTKGKKYTLIESDNIFFKVINDLGNEQLYYNYRFKRL